MRRIWTIILAAAGMLVMILDSKTALMGAAEGLELCVKSVIPSLFPFFVLSMLLTSALSGTKMTLLRPVGKLCGIPKGAESLIAVGLLGGYPVGAQTVAQLYRDGSLSEKSARRLLGFCSNAGPAFIFGIVAGKFSNVWMGWALWIIHILSALLVGAILPGKENGMIRHSKQTNLKMTDALSRSITVCATVCGWVVLFRVLMAFMSRWILWMIPQNLQVTVIGLLELANGCCELDLIRDENLRFVIASAVLAFGGLCVTMQTASVTEGLGLGYYLRGKLLQTLLSVAIAVFVMKPHIWPTLFLALAGICCRELKKRSRNPSSVSV